MHLIVYGEDFILSPPEDMVDSGNTYAFSMVFFLFLLGY